MAWMIVLAVIALPVVEIALFVKSSQAFGVLPTIAAAILAGMAGLALLRAQGAATAWRIREQLQRGEVPVGDAFDAVCLAVAGLLLLLPGFLTDLIALSLLLPPVRALLRLWLARRLAGAVRPVNAGPPVIEGDFRVIERDRKP
ncbi:MAG: FxsA family protein [Magnetospirillum sp.]|nr:FxsA family protein [Magnetospirillum sp.]